MGTTSVPSRTLFRTLEVANGDTVKPVYNDPVYSGHPVHNDH